ncbi:hypothetical protein CC1G_03434 [Coprinopsis cinerea okayama7|uniref:Uncharacterized protein n=1 Tax=Coprinopsis cinerea (strain Okayama-7 / 130 / ATCC MYA-4618 / FGSC 9003) TaxID=240176 RepID=A8NQQ3_COPC7|nr:hypothetical protein CC1G_03434 [Coprinopsis cinerea okayama7\|eukprot:XP_001835652.2 hypothetical protein CC1G_03434 [Coprinopsis cinerea okayama7\
MDRGRGGRGRGNAWRNNSRGYHNGQSNTRNSNPQRPHDDQHQGSGGRGRGRGRGGIGGGFSRGNFKTPMPSRMELMASVSRSSGLERDGDDLKNYNIQQEYREFIQGKLDGFSKRYPLEIRSADKQRIEAQENLLILFTPRRRLRLKTTRRVRSGGLRNILLSFHHLQLGKADSGCDEPSGSRDIRIRHLSQATVSPYDRPIPAISPRRVVPFANNVPPSPSLYLG